MSIDHNWNTYVIITLSLLWPIAIFQGIAILVIVRDIAVINRLAELGSSTAAHLPIGTRAPKLTGEDCRSGITFNGKSLIGRRTVLLFLSGDCSVCKSIAAGLSESTNNSLAGLVIGWHGTRRMCDLYFGNISADVAILLSDESDMLSAFNIKGFPILVVVNDQWKIESVRHPADEKEVLKLLAQPAQDLESGYVTAVASNV